MTIMENVNIYGVSHNENMENRGDVKSASVSGCEFTDAKVQISASEKAEFANNEMSFAAGTDTDKVAHVFSHTNPDDESVVTATGNKINGENTELKDGYIVEPEPAPAPNPPAPQPSAIDKFEKQVDNDTDLYINSVSMGGGTVKFTLSGNGATVLADGAVVYPDANGAYTVANNAKVTITYTNVEVDIPKTGDASIIGYAVMAILAAAGAMGIKR